MCEHHLWGESDGLRCTLPSNHPPGHVYVTGSDHLSNEGASDG